MYGLSPLSCTAEFKGILRFIARLGHFGTGAEVSAPVHSEHEMRPRTFKRDVSQARCFWNMSQYDKIFATPNMLHVPYKQ